MQTVNPEVTTAVLAAFGEAWNRHDVDAHRSGRSREHGGMQLASKFMVAICSLFATA